MVLLITIIYLSIYLFILLFISTLSLRFIFPLVSLEGMAFWKLKSAPVKESFYITRKLLPAGFIIFVCGQGLNLFANLKLGKDILCISATLTAIISLAIIAINFGMGMMFANYKEKNPIRLSSSQGASITFLITLCYLLFVVLLLFSPFAHIFYSIRIDQPFKIGLLLKPVIPITVVSILLIVAFLKNGYSYLKKDF
jgi:ABC-2 type transport system permease protein